MERRVVLALVMVFAAWAAGSAVQAAPSALQTTVGSLASNDEVTWVGYQSGSWAVAGNDWDSQAFDEFLPGATTAALAAVTGPDAGAAAATDMASVSAAAAASTGPGSSAAYAYAQQDVWFRTNKDATLTFVLDYAIDQTLTSQWGASAFADTSVGLSLYREDGTPIGDEQVFYAWNYVADGDSGVFPYDSALLVGGSGAWFAAGEYGYVHLRVDGQALAAVIPAPGALLLTAMGAGLVGYVRRRNGRRQ